MSNEMRFATLGRTGVQISVVTLGAAFFGGRISTDDSRRILDRAFELGINSIDTAEAYLNPNPNTSEEVLGDLLNGRRDEVFLATKVSPHRSWQDQIANRGLTRRVVVQAVEGSLRRLQTDHVDLIYAHGQDPLTPLEETLAAFDDLIRSGKVRYAGLSNHTPAQLTEAMWIADRQRMRPIAAAQDLFNLLERSKEKEHLPVCRRHGIGVLAYSPLAGGLLSGKYTWEMVDDAAKVPVEARASYFGRESDASAPATSFPKLTEPTVAAAARVTEWAEKRGHTAAQVSLAWVISEPVVTSAILGVTTLDQLEENAPAFDLELAEGERKELAELAAT